MLCAAKQRGHPIGCAPCLDTHPDHYPCDALPVHG